MNSRSILALALASASAALAVETTPVGYTTIECKANSDTIVGVPLRQSAAFAGSLSASPDTTTIPGSAILSLAGSPTLTVNQYANTHYAKFKSGTASGKWFTVTANTATSLTVNLNGDTLTASSADQLEVIKFWTLAELFNPADSTADPLTTKNAIVLTTSTLSRRTEVLLPNLTAVGTNIAPSVNYFIFNGAWRKVGQPISSSFNSDQLWPDTYFIIRHPSTFTSSTYFTNTGEVETGSMEIGLTTQNSVKQDNFIGIPRPVDVRLADLNLGGTSAFRTTISTLSRLDELLVFNNATQARNKAPSSNYFYFQNAWRKVGAPITDNFNNDVIPAGTGFIIRKHQVTGGPTQAWNQTSSY